MREARQIIAELWVFLRPYRWGLAGALIFLVASVPLSQVHPLVWRYVVDELLLKQQVHGLLAALGVMVGAQLFAQLFGALQTYFLEKAGQSFVRDVRNAVFAKLGDQSLAYHHGRRTGDLVTRVISDVDAMENSVLREISNLFEEVLTFVIVAVVVIWLQPKVGLCTMIPIMFSFVLIKAFGVRIKGVYEEVRRRLGDIGAFVHDRLAGVQLTQSFARQPAERARFREVTQSHFAKSIRALRLRVTFLPMVSMLGFMSNVVMLGLGAWFIWKGEFTLGGLIAYRGYWWRLQSPINTIARMSDTLLRARASALRVLEVLRQDVGIRDSPGATPWPSPRGEICFDNVSFAYRPDTPVLRGVSFRVAAGEFVAVAGRSGSGKTTLLNLIPRFYEPGSGRILLDGHAAATLTLASVRSHMALVLQETYLFNETVRDNIRYARPGACDAEVEEAARRANAQEFILAFPEGYDTVVGERGVKLSGGQKQRLSVARAFLADPPVLLLDEPTSSVEPESEDLIHQSILDLTRSRTTVLATHRVTLLRRAPRILFFAKGELCGDGPHDVLLAQCPGYAAAYEDWEHEEQAAP